MDERRVRNSMNGLITQDVYDVVILGGGIAGLALAMQLSKARPATSILVVEKQKHPVPEAAHKVGESTVEIAAYYLRDVLGLEEHLKAQQLDKFGLRMFFSNNGNHNITHRVELGHAVLPPHGVGTYQLDRGRLENMLGNELSRCGVTFRDNCKVQHICLQPQQEYHRLSVLHQGNEREIQARWVVDASGRSSLLKRQLGLAKKVEHCANAAWFRIGYPIDINQWSRDQAWHDRIRQGERSLSTNHLMGPGYWVWLIRLASGAISIGIVTDATMHRFEEMNRFERAMTWLHAYEPQCAQEIEQYRDKVQDFRVMKDYSYSCEQVYSGDRWCLTGEAGVFLDPFYSPGLDMIAISNGLVCDLITHALDGEDIEERAAVHNQIYLTLAESWLRIYNQQYPLMGNAQVMVAKVIWDTAVYWAVPGLLYFHDKFRQLIEYPGIVMNLARFSVVSEYIQRFFRDWHAIDQSPASDTFISFYDFDFMARLQIGMTAGLSDAEVEAQFAANVHFIEQLSGQLVSTVIERCLAQPENRAIQEQVRIWQADPFLSNLVGVYQQGREINPISDDWITLKGHYQAREEVTK